MNSHRPHTGCLCHAGCVFDQVGLGDHHVHTIPTLCQAGMVILVAWFMLHHVTDVLVAAAGGRVRRSQQTRSALYVLREQTSAWPRLPLDPYWQILALPQYCSQLCPAGSVSQAYKSSILQIRATDTQLGSWVRLSLLGSLVSLDQ